MPEVPQPVRMDSQALIVALVDGVLTIRLDRPEARNALTDEMLAGLRRALERAASDHDVRAVVLTGTGDAFCSAMTAESIGQSLLIGTEDHRDGRRARSEGRPPRFTGR